MDVPRIYADFGPKQLYITQMFFSQQGAGGARAGSLAGLSPTFIGVDSIDLSFAEDVEYAKRLALSGVSTEQTACGAGWREIAASAVRTQGETASAIRPTRICG